MTTTPKTSWRSFFCISQSAAKSFCHKLDRSFTKYIDMSGFWSVVILGIVQGLTEFLPVSSSGHLVLLSQIFGIEDSLFVSIILHLATLLSVVVVLRKEVWQIVRHPFSGEGKKLIFATIPTCIIVLPIYPFVSASFEGDLLPLCFAISAVLLFSTEMFSRKRVAFESGEVSNKQAIIMGAVQGLATLPGISRSGSTICAGVLANGDRKRVAKFSFLMSIPIIILSLLLEIYQFASTGAVLSVNVAGLVVGFLLAFVIGALSIRAMIKVTSSLNFKWFGGYLLALAIVTLILKGI